MLSIVLVIKLFLNKHSCLIVSRTQPKVTRQSSCMDMTNCVVSVIVSFFFDRVLICKYMTGSSRQCLPLQETERSLMNTAKTLLYGVRPA